MFPFNLSFPVDVVPVGVGVGGGGEEPSFLSSSGSTSKPTSSFSNFNNSNFTRSGNKRLKTSVTTTHQNNNSNNNNNNNNTNTTSNNSNFPFNLNCKVEVVVSTQPVVTSTLSSIPPPPPTLIKITKEQWLSRLAISQDDADNISTLEQGSDAWLESRKGRITASNFGAAIGLNKYTSPRSLLKQMLWDSFKGNAATQWGSAHEDIARIAFIEYRRAEYKTNMSHNTEAVANADTIPISIDVKETGLIINPDRPWMGNSPDGIITITYASGRKDIGLLEIKCPYRKEFYNPPVPIYYNAQIQGTMGNLNLPWCDFVVWTPDGIQITHVPFDAAFWNDTLLPGLTTFYFDMYLPAAVNKENGLLQPGSIEVEPDAIII